MKVFSAFTITCATLFSACSLPAQSPKASPVQSSTGSSFAVVELFTSEGCSSCPPADVVLAKLAAAYKGQAVLLIEEHVDYWDRLGWKDPFSQKIFTERQYTYGTHFGTDGVYTPQVVINGSVQMVGSGEAAVRKAVDGSLESTKARPVSLTKESADKDGITVGWTADIQKGEQLILMLVQRKAEIEVHRGENGGRSLSHTNVVRGLLEMNTATGKATLPVPAGLSNTDYFVAAIIQRQGGTITGMGRLDL